MVRVRDQLAEIRGEPAPTEFFVPAKAKQKPAAESDADG